MKYLFILGRNIELSVAEVKSYMRKTGNEIIESSLKENGFLVELENSIDAGAVDDLGGTISIGVVICNIKDIDKKEIYFGSENKFNYVVWDFSENTDDVSEYLKSRFRKEKLKAVHKKMTGNINSQDGEKLRNVSSNLIDEEYFVYENYFGRITQKCDYKKIEKEDMEKPVRRESLSISPRLAKILVNLSEVKSGEKIADVFCGIGVVLIEALKQEIKVVGVDRDGKAISGAGENLKWFGFPTENYKLHNDDSSKIKIENVSGVASEPDFGEILKKIPTSEKAEAMIKNYENLMIRVLNNVKKSVLPDGKIVFTSPLISVGRKRIGADLAKLSSATGLKIAKGFPIKEFREGQIVGREVVVFIR